MGDDSKSLQDDKNLWPEDLKRREEQWQKNGGSPVSSKKHFDRKPPSPPMPPPTEGNPRSRSRSRERRRSRSRGYSPEYRRRQESYEYRRRPPIRRSPERRPVRRERSRDRNRSRNRSRSRDRRDRSLSRGRSRRDWSPPKGRRSPIRRPSTPPPPNINAPPPYIPQPIYSDGYNYPSGPYGQNMPPQQFGGYDFPGQGPPQSYVPPYPPPPPVLMPPGASGESAER